MAHILEKYNKEKHFFNDPFPHIIIEDCLDDNVYNLLQKNFPENDSFSPLLKEENQAYWIYGKDLLKLSSIWSNFIDDHVCQDFFDQATDLIRPFMTDLDPDYVSNLGGKLADCTFSLAESGREHNPNNKKTNIVISVAVGINTPCETRSILEPPHADFPQKLFNSLLYMRSDDDDDDTICGDLVLYKTNDSFLFNGKKGRNEVDMKYLTAVKKIKYQKKIIIKYPNKVNAVHGVTARGPTSHTRRYININMESYVLKRKAFFEPPRSLFTKIKFFMLDTPLLRLFKYILRPLYHFMLRKI